MWNFSTTKWADVLFYGMPHFFFSPTKYHRTKILKKNSTGASG